MDIQALRDKESAVVVQYRASRRYSHGWRRHSAVFLSDNQLFKLRVELAIKSSLKFATVTTHFGAGYPSLPPIFQFVLSSPATDQIHNLETILDKPGQIEFLILQAEAAPTGSAKKDDLTVSFKTWEELDAFGDFSAEAKVETGSEPMDGLRFYEYVETAHSLLNDVVAGYNRLAFREKEKDHPDTDFLTELEANKTLALTLLRQPKTFLSADKLSEVIDDYTPIVRALYTTSSHSAAS